MIYDLGITKMTIIMRMMMFQKRMMVAMVRNK
jgi:hypothetical protein